MEISQRQTIILERITEEYIESAKPISSRLLEKKCHLGISPATIRIEMQKLTESGYLFQPHTSAGRIPTDRGYRFFVDSFTEKGKKEKINISRAREILEQEGDNLFGRISQLTKFLSETSSAFAIGGLMKENFFSKEGWNQVLKEPEFEDKELLLDFTNFLNEFENQIENLKINSQAKVFIGQENPFKGGEEFSVVLAECRLPKKEKGIISIIGPKRMIYSKNINLINSLTKLLEDF